MTNQILELLKNRAESYIMSIRIQPDGLALSGFIPNEKGSFFYIDRNSSRRKLYADCLKDSSFVRDWLCLPFKKLYVLQAYSYCTAVPIPFYQRSQKVAMYEYSCGKCGEKVIDVTVEDLENVLLYSMEADIYSFCKRTFDNPKFICAQVPLFFWWKRENLKNSDQRMFIHLSRRQLDIACFKNGYMHFANSYFAFDKEEILYYVLKVFKKLELDPNFDVLSICGDSLLLNDVYSGANSYIRNVKKLDIPVDTYLLGDDLMRIPTDIKVLMVNENN